MKRNRLWLFLLAVIALAIAGYYIGREIALRENAADAAAAGER